MVRPRGGWTPWRIAGAVAIIVIVLPQLIGALAAIVGAIVAVPIILVVVVIAMVFLLAALAIAIAATAGVIALPAWLAWRATRDGRSARDPLDSGAARTDPVDADADRLRRRYVAGELTEDQFRDSMLSNLKQRFTAGSIDINDYEAEVGRLVRASAEAPPLQGLRRSVPPAPPRR